MSDTTPKLRVLSCGAGVQSTAIVLLAAEGAIPKPDVAIFSDTGWEPQHVYDHLERLTREVADPAGIPIRRVSNGNLRDDSLNVGHRYASLPLYLIGESGEEGMGRRQCTSEYKVVPIKRAVRELLGYPHPTPVPRGTYVEQWLGISLDEVHRARDSDVSYMRNAFPLLDLKMTRKDCLRYLERRGWGQTPKSACIGCPFHGNRAWRDMRDNDPQSWADAVEFDRLLRTAEVREHLGLRGVPFLHRSRVPLDRAPIDRVTRAEWGEAQTDIYDALDDLEEPEGCSPFACRGSEEPVA